MSQSSFPTSLGNTASLVDFVANLKIMFAKGYGSFESSHDSAKMLYITRYEGSGAGDRFQYEEPLTALQLARETDEGDNFNTNEIAPGYYKTVTVKRRSSGVQFTWHWEYHNKYPEQAMKLYQDIGYSLRYRIELDLIHPFTFGTATTYTNIDGRSVDIAAGDGFQLFYSAHTLTNSVITYRTRLANDPIMTPGSVEDMQTLYNQQTYDNNGNRRPAFPDLIVVGSDEANHNRALRIVKSVSPVDAAHAGVMNPQQNKYRVARLMWLDSDNQGSVDTTKADWWMMVDTMNLGAYLAVTENPNVTLPTVSNGGIVFDNDNRKAKGTATYEPVVLSAAPYRASCPTS